MENAEIYDPQSVCPSGRSYCVYVGSVCLTSSCIQIWDETQNDFVEIESDIDCGLLYFYVPQGIDRVSVNFGASNINRNPNIKISNVGANYVMAEEGTFDEEDLCANDFAGYDTSNYSLLGEAVQINTVASNPMSYNTIYNSLFVFDYIDGTLTNSKQVLSNTYGTSDYKVGDWQIVFRVTNSRNISSNITINVHVEDDIDPVISGPNEFTMRNIDNKTLDDVKETLSATDNHDGDISSSIEVDSTSDAFTNRETELGTFPVRFKVSDDAGNMGFHIVNVKVVQGDFNGPVFSGTFSYERLTTEPLTEAQVLANVTANDDYSGDVTDRIQVLYNDYKYNTNRVGTYRISLYVKDNAGNATRKDISIKVYENSAPTFVYDPVVLYIPLKSNMETTGDIIRLLQRTGYFSDDEVIVKSDGYSENKNVLGQYIITLEQDDLERTVLINVEEGMEYLNCIELPKSVEYNIDFSSRPAFLNMIYDVCCRVKAFFKDFFDAIF